MAMLNKKIDVPKMIELHKEGKSLRDIGDYVGISYPSVKYYLNRAGIDTGRERKVKKSVVSFTINKELIEALEKEDNKSELINSLLIKHYGIK